MSNNDCYLGIDVGSVSTDFALLNSNKKLIRKVYLKTEGQPINIIKKGIKIIKKAFVKEINMHGYVFWWFSMSWKTFLEASQTSQNKLFKLLNSLHGIT